MNHGRIVKSYGLVCRGACRADTYLPIHGRTDIDLGPMSKGPEVGHLGPFVEIAAGNVKPHPGIR